MRQSDTGDRQGALQTITEAVTHYRTLADTNPAFLPDLASSLNNLSNQQSNTGDRQSGLLTSDQVISSFPSGPQAELLVSRAHWRFTHDDQAGAITDLIFAARHADETTDPTWTGRARRTVRQAIDVVRQDCAAKEQLDQATTGLPTWAVAVLPDESVERFNRWLSARVWSGREDFLRQTYALLATPDEQTTLVVTQALYPEATALNELSDLLQEAADRGLEPVLDEHRALHAAADLLSRWLSTPTWPEDLAFLRDHPSLTDDPLIRALLSAGSEDLSSLQHLGILDLTERLEIPDIYDAVTDPTTAVDTAMGFIEQGQPEGVRPLLLAAPTLTRMPFITLYLNAVHQLFAASDECRNLTPDPAELIARARAEGSEVQRGAGAARLRTLARHRPEHSSALHDLADALTAPSEDDLVEETAPDAG